MAEAPGFDVYLSYNRADFEIVQQLHQDLEQEGFEVFSDVTAIAAGVNWQDVLTSALSTAAFVAICVGPTGLGDGQLREIEAAEARGAVDPDFRYAAVLLPGVPEDFPAAALPFQLRSRQWLDLRSGSDSWLALVSSVLESSRGGAADDGSAEDRPPATPSVTNATARLTGEVTAAQIVLALLRLHPEYGERRGGEVELAPTGQRATTATWLKRVRDLLDKDAVTELHGRLLIVGLARVDPALGLELQRGGFLAAVEGEIREPLATLFVAEPSRPEDTVPTHTDNPATVDELNREGVARLLAERIRGMRDNETAASKASGDKQSPRGRSFLVHMNGPWGSGKTSLLNFLRDELHKSEPKPWVVVTFNAWQHQRLAPPWWWLMGSLYHGGFHELWRISKRRALLFRVREWLWRLKGGWQGLVMVVGAATLMVVLWRTDFFDSFSTGEALSYKTAQAIIVGVAAVLAPVVAIWGVGRSAGRWLLTTSARGARIYIQNARDPMQTTKQHFAELVDWLGYSLVIVIDDLDRCEPTFVVELLEGVQTLFRDVPVAYVVAADREWLALSYATQYHAFEGEFDEPGRPLGYLFLEKTFQMTLPVPVLDKVTRDDYWRHLLRPAAPAPVDRGELERARANAGLIYSKLETEEAVRDELLRDPGATPAEQRARLEAAAIQLATPKLEQAAEHVLLPFRPLLDSNPRAMKRLVNAYGLARGMELLNRRTLGGGREAQHRTALWTILSLRWPRLAEYLAAKPDIADEFGRTDPGARGVRAEFAPLFLDREVLAVVFGQADGVAAKLDPDSIRLCVSA
jgi:hypothetical protein